MAFPKRPVLLALAVLVCGINLRPALTSVSALYGPIATDLALPVPAAMALTGLPVLLFGAAGFLGPALGRRFGAGRALGLGLVLFGLALGLRPFGGVPAMLAGTVLACVMIGVLGVLLPAAIAENAGDKLGPHTALMTFGIVGGAALGSAMALPLAAVLAGWRGALAVWMLPALAAGLFWLALSPRPQRAVERVGLHLPWRSPYAWVLTLFMGTQSSLAFMVFIWLAPLLADRDLSPALAAQMVAISVGAQLASALAVPWLARDPRGLGLWGAASVVLTLCSLLGLLFADRVLLVPLALLLGLGQGGNLAIAFAMILANPERVPTAALSSMVQGFGYLLAGFGPLWLGAIRPMAGSTMLAGMVITVAGVAAAGSSLLAGRFLRVGDNN